MPVPTLPISELDETFASTVFTFPFVIAPKVLDQHSGRP